MPVHLGHLRLDVEDLDRQTAFYCEVLGLTVRERATDDESHYAFLMDSQPIPGGATDGMHHRLVLRQSRDAGGRALGSTTWLDHFAWEVDDEAEVLAVVERLQEMGVETDLQEAQIAWQCYLGDPEGVKPEVYCDRRQRPEGALGRLRGHSPTGRPGRARRPPAGQSTRSGSGGGGVVPR